MQKHEIFEQPNFSQRSQIPKKKERYYKPSDSAGILHVVCTYTFLGLADCNRLELEFRLNLDSNAESNFVPPQLRFAMIIVGITIDTRFAFP